MKTKYPINTFSEETQKEIIEVIEFEKLKIKSKFQTMITKEIAEAHLKGESTSRLTKIFNKIKL